MKFLITLLFVFTLVSCNQKNRSPFQKNKVVIAHRGASGYLPEHTLEAKAMAYAMHPDYIEQDLVLSKDNVPIVYHDIYLDKTTDVAKKFSDRKRNDGRYYVIDFTYEELLSLKVMERFDLKTGKQIYPNRFPKDRSSFKLHSLQDEIELIQGLNHSTGNDIGIYPEIKNPKFHYENDKDISKIILNILTQYKYQNKKDNCILQCFDTNELERIRTELNSNLRLVQLIENPKNFQELTHISSYADGVAPWYKNLISKNRVEKIIFNSLINDAHKLGMFVHPYTFRVDEFSEFSSFKHMVKAILFEADADGGFTDFPDIMRNLSTDQP